MHAADTPEVQAHLLANDHLYRELASLHHQLDDRLQQLNALVHLSDAEHLEEVRLKKRKLALKDQMLQIATHWSRSHQDS